ncbi:MAG: carboxypeptidase-like regulatory domain-containing protein [Planctomycetota bacterium]
MPSVPDETSIPVGSDSPSEAPTVDQPTTVPPDRRSDPWRKDGDLAVRVTGSRGEPVTGAKVRWIRGESRIEKDTDHRGMATAERLPLGSWRITVTAPEYLEASISVRLDRGRIDRTVPIRLVKGGVLAGRVLTESGTPIEGARVDWIRTDEQLATTRSGASGEFHLSDLPLTTGTLRVTHPRHRPYLEAQAVNDETVEIRLAESRLEVSGRVVEARSESPIAGVSVRPSLGRASQDRSARSSATELPEVVTDDQGRFVIAGLSPGWIHLTALHPDFAPGNESLRVGDSGAADVVIRLAPGMRLQGHVVSLQSRNPVPGLEIVGAGPDGQRFTLRTDDAGAFALLAPIREGQVVRWSTRSEDWVLSPPVEAPASERPFTLMAEKAASIQGVVTDGESRRPVPGARIRLQDSEGSASSEDVSDTEGRFTIKGIRSTGQTVLLATHPDYVATTSRSGISAASLIELRIVMKPGLRLTGHVRTPEGVSVEGASVLVRRGTDQLAALTSDTDGAFRSPALDEGQYTVLAEWQGEESEAEDVELTDETKEVILTIGATPSIRGRVVDEAGSALSGIRLMLRTSERIVAEARTDDEGRFRFAHLEESEEYLLDLGGNRRFDPPEPSPLRPDRRDHTIRLTHRRTGSVEGFVEVSSGTPPITLDVEAHRQDRIEEPPTGEVVRPASGTGRFRLDDVPAGEYRFILIAEGFRRSEIPGRVEPDRTLALGRIVLEPE